MGHLQKCNGYLLVIAALLSIGCMSDDEEGDMGYNDKNTAGTGNNAGDPAYDLAYGPEERDDGTHYETEGTVRTIEPQCAGRFVFVSDPAQDSVVVVDSDTLEIQVVEVGIFPSHLVTLPGEPPRIAVINLNSDDVTIIDMVDEKEFQTMNVSVRPDTNALAPSPDGRFIIAYHDPEYTEISGPPNTDQEISIIKLDGEVTSVAQSTGAHPWKVVYNEDVTTAFVVNEGGINVIDLTDINNALTQKIPLFESGSYNRNSADIEITPDGNIAVARKTDTPELMVAYLDGAEATRSYPLPAPPTDLDLAADGSFGMVVLKSLNEVLMFDLPFPEDPEADPFTHISLEDRIATFAAISDSGNQVLLHTTEADTSEALRRLTLLTREEDNEWSVTSAVLERPIESVEMMNVKESDARTAVVIHKPVSASATNKPYGYTLVTVPDLMTKLQQLETQPGQLLPTPDGSHGFLLIPDSKLTDKIDMKNLIVDHLALASPPTAAGYAAETDKVFVTQNHTSGRMSFIGVSDDSFKTVTGFNLDAEIEIGNQGE